MGGNNSTPAPTPEPVKPSPEFDEPWRIVDWSKKEQMIKDLTGIQVGHPEVSHLRILLHGPVGAGKSCFINSVSSIFKGRITQMADEESNAGKSFTKVYKAYTITNNDSQTLPFIINDVMGLENKAEDGINPDDVLNALQGHIRDGHKFNPTSPLNDQDPDFIKNPSLNDKVHCLVSVVPANTISLMEEDIIKKMRTIRNKASSLKIPHVVVLTKVDEACPLVKKDLKEIYRSRKIKEKMQECSQRLGPSVKFIFPVSNYHEECDTNTSKDVLLLMALQQIVWFAVNYVKDNHPQLQDNCMLCNML